MTGRQLYWNCPHCGAEFTGTETEDAHTLKLVKGKDVFPCSTCGNLCCSNCKVVCEECLEPHGPGCEHTHIEGETFSAVVHIPSGGDCPDMGPEPEYNNRNFPYEGHVKDE